MRRTKLNSSKSTIAPKQAKIIEALVRGETVTAAAKQARVNRTTIHGWIRFDSAFQAELNRAKTEQADCMAAQLRGLADKAVEVIRATLEGPRIPAAVRLKAALAVLRSVGTLEPEEPEGTDRTDLKVIGSLSISLIDAIIDSDSESRGE